MIVNEHVRVDGNQSVRFRTKAATPGLTIDMYTDILTLGS